MGCDGKGSAYLVYIPERKEIIKEWYVELCKTKNTQGRRRRLDEDESATREGEQVAEITQTMKWRTQ